MDVYVVVFVERGNNTNPAWIVGAYSKPQKAMDACQEEVEHEYGRSLPLTWHGGDGAWWTDAQPFGYRINRMTVDARPADSGPAPAPTP